MDKLCQREAEKYKRIWARPEYRRFSPGEVDADKAYAMCKMEPGDSLTDFGAGTGRATAWFAQQGLDVLAVDFVPEALETDVPLAEVCLWDMGRKVRKADLGYCCDVMEHVPGPKVDAVLKGIAARVRRGCYFRIALRPDVCGQLIGEVLHLTVMPADWWLAELSKHFGGLHVAERNSFHLVVWARP